MIDGTATMRTAGRKLSITENHIGLLPPVFEGTLVSDIEPWSRSASDLVGGPGRLFR